MKKLLFPIVILLLVVCAGCNALEHEVSLSDADLQKIIAKKFPVERNAIAAGFTLHSPKVYFQDNAIGLSLQYSAAVLLNNFSGDAAFTCKPVYRPETTSFYMTDFVMTRFAVKHLGSLENTPITASISTAVGALFKDYPVYTLNQDEFKQNLTMMMLKSVSVKDNHLVLLLSL